MTGAQRGDFDSPPASSPTDRRDADDATFAAELARLNRLEVADEDTVERVARAIYEAKMPPTAIGWKHSRESEREPWRRLARAAIAELSAPGTECRHVGKRGLDCDCDEPASGTDSSGQAVQRVRPGPCSECIEQIGWHGHCLNPHAHQPAVTGPQRDHDEEGQ